MSGTNIQGMTLDQMIEAMRNSVPPKMRKKADAPPAPPKPKKEKSTHNGLTENALKMIRDNPGITTTELSKRLGKDRNGTTVRLLIRQERQGKILKERMTNETKWWIKD